ncbi:MAG TPA: RagB/SusD family nutrient uptake outer membrane protein [Longimicrobium sp.]|nr:RagB/SusD family nutrient uptake outer membrane protein [Longimicrobium sp.]
MHSLKRLARAALAVAALALGGAGCDLLEVDNPGAIEPPALEDPRYIPLMVNGVIGEFQPTLPVAAYYTAVFADELRNHHVFFEERLIDQRRVGPENATYVAFVYNVVHRSRFMADSVAGRLKVLLADSASRDPRLARVQAYAGYNYVLLGEWLCESPVNGSRPYSSQELLRDFALPRFDEAIAVATAARNRSGATAAQIASADSIINFAKVGAARAALWLGDKPKAISYATGVPAAFEYRAFYSENSARENNPLWNRFSNGSGNTSGSVSNTPFAQLNDPRVPHPVAAERVMDATNAFIPNSPSAYNTFNNTAIGAEWARAGYMRVASGLEARYILAEATGPTAESIAFIESRRAIAPTGTAAAATTADNFFANLREQRGRDLFLDGHRLGDIRRYQTQYGINYFPTGTYYGTTSGETFGDQTCLPLSLAEITGNPNVPRT